MTFGRYLKIQRVKKGWNQTQLGSYLGVSSCMVSYYEKDKRFPTAKVMNRLLHLLKLDKELLKTYILNHFTNQAMNYFGQFKPL